MTGRKNPRGPNLSGGRKRGKWPLLLSSFFGNAFRPGGAGLALAAAVLGPLLLYALTLPRTVVLEDDGLFLMVGAHLGVAHPPGYPLYTLILYLFMKFPFGGAAFLGHLSSAVLGALACGAVYLCARTLQPSRLAALAAAWLFAASEHFWSQAIIAEVYALNALLFFACYALILHGVRHAERAWVWTAAAAVYGLSLANHWPLMLLAAPGLLLAALPAWRGMLRKLPLLLAAFLPCAILPYAWMVWRSLQEPAISFYGPLGDWDSFWHYFSRRGYSEVDASPSAGWEDRLAFLQWFGNELVWQLTLPGFALALLGLFVLLRRRRFAEAGSGLLAFLGNSVALIGLLSFDYDYFRVAVFRPYSLVCYGIAALWLAVGLQFLLERWSVWPPFAFARAFARGTGFQAGAAALAGLGMAAFSVQANWQTNNRSGSDFAERYAETMFSLLPPDAVLFTFGDTEIGPLGYYRFVEGRRPDITLLSFQGLVYGNRLYPWQLSRRRKEKILRRFVNESVHPVFFTFDDKEFPHDHGIRHHGFVKEIARGETPGTVALKPHPEGDRYFERLLNRQFADSWERLRRDKLLHLYGRYLGYAVLSGDSALPERTRRAITLAERNFFSLTGMIEILLEHGKLPHLPRVEGWLEQAERLRDDSLSKERLARFLYLQGFLRHRLGQPEAAIALFRESSAIYPHPENSSIEALEQLGLAP